MVNMRSTIWRLLQPETATLGSGTRKLCLKKSQARFLWGLEVSTQARMEENGENK